MSFQSPMCVIISHCSQIVENNFRHSPWKKMTCSPKPFNYLKDNYIFDCLPVLIPYCSAVEFSTMIGQKVLIIIINNNFL